jgi:hypothetical protein
MGWRSNRWPAHTPRPRVAKLSVADLDRLHASSGRLVARSAVLKELVAEVELLPGRVYFWRGEGDLMARVTPLSP